MWEQMPACPHGLESRVRRKGEQEDSEWITLTYPHFSYKDITLE